MTNRSRATLLAGAAVFAGLVLLHAQPSSGATSHAGQLQIHGPGTTYTASYGTAVSEAVAAGGAASYSLKIVNIGQTVGQFEVRLNANSGNPAATTLYSATLDVTSLATSTPGFVTQALAPGKNQVLTVKVSPLANDPQGITFTNVDLYAMDGTHVSGQTMETNVQAPAKGTTAWDLFVRNGSQPWVGGSYTGPYGGQAETAPSIATTGSAQYTVRLQNDSTASTTVGLHMTNATPECDSFPVRVMDGTANVTAKVLAGTYVTPTPLAAGAHRDLIVTVKYSTAGNGCDRDDYQVSSLVGFTSTAKFSSDLMTNLAA